MGKFYKSVFVFFLVLVISAFTGCHVEKTDIPSLASYYYQNSEIERDGFIFKPNLCVHCQYYDITLCEYFLDKTTGIGAVKCSMSTENYDKYEERILLRILPQYLVTERDMYTAEKDGNTYLYYSFVVQDTEDEIKLYFEADNAGRGITLSYTETEYKEIKADDETAELLISPFGIKSVKDSDSGTETTEITVFDSTNNFESKWFTSKIMYRTEEKLTTIYVFKEYEDI